MKPTATGLAVNASANSKETKSRGYACPLQQRDFAKLFFKRGEGAWGLVPPRPHMGRGMWADNPIGVGIFAGSSQCLLAQTAVALHRLGPCCACFHFGSGGVIL